VNKKVDFPANTLPISPELLDIVQGFNSNELFWLSGYCTGLAKGRDSSSVVGSANLPLPTQISPSSVDLKVQVLYASQTGNSQEIAESLFETIGQKGLPAQIACLDDFKAKDLAKLQIILLVVSTHGEGEPPDDAIDFLELINSKRGPKLNNIQHAVLALGDSSYEFFCQTGKDFDQAFSQLGSTSLVERVDCDLDYEELSSQWINSVVAKLAELSSSIDLNSNNSAVAGSSNIQVSGVSYTKDKPFVANILANQRITGSSSSKQVHHIEISLEDSGIQYLPGDSIGIWAKNNQQLVNELLALVKLNGEESVLVKDVEKTLKQALTENLEITLINKSFVENYAKQVALTNEKGSKKLLTQVNKDYSAYIKVHQIIDVMTIAPISLKAQQLVDLLKPIKPRIYSISSSLEANPEEAHITVALKESINENSARFGTASHFLTESLKEDDDVLVFIEENKRFKLPEENTPMIMIGPGTGIAPFRSFLQQREEQSSKGDNWLFFGNAHFNTDFLYQTEIQKMQKSGLLTQVDLAFSRDQKNKIYVQDRLLEKAGDVWQWLNEKQASLYVCGDMNHMAKDVEKALITIISEQGNKSQKDAEQYLKTLKKENRYQRDVY